LKYIQLANKNPVVKGALQQVLTKKKSIPSTQRSNTTSPQLLANIISGKGRLSDVAHLDLSELIAPVKAELIKNLLKIPKTTKATDGASPNLDSENHTKLQSIPTDTRTVVNPIVEESALPAGKVMEIHDSLEAMSEVYMTGSTESIANYKSTLRKVAELIE